MLIPSARRLRLQAGWPHEMPSQAYHSVKGDIAGFAWMIPQRKRLVFGVGDLITQIRLLRVSHSVGVVRSDLDTAPCVVSLRNNLRGDKWMPLMSSMPGLFPQETCGHENDRKYGLTHSLANPVYQSINSEWGLSVTHCPTIVTLYITRYRIQSTQGQLITRLAFFIQISGVTPH